MVMTYDWYNIKKPKYTQQLSSVNIMYLKVILTHAIWNFLKCILKIPDYFLEGLCNGVLFG